MVHITQALKRQYTHPLATITTQLHERPLPQICNSETSPHVPLSTPSKTHTCFDWIQATPDAKVLPTCNSVHCQFVTFLDKCTHITQPKHNYASRRQLTHWSFENHPCCLISLAPMSQEMPVAPLWKLARLPCRLPPVGSMVTPLFSTFFFCCPSPPWSPGCFLPGDRLQLKNITLFFLYCKTTARK